MITYEVNQADLNYVRKRLDQIGSKGPTVIKNALNKTAKEARKKLASGAQSAYTVKSGGFNSRMKIKNATVSSLEAEITSQDRPLTLIRFRYTAPKGGGRADITNSGYKALTSSKGGKAVKRKGLMMHRTAARRLPVKVLRSNSVPKMLEKVYEGDRGIEGELQPVIAKSLHDEIRAQIAKLV